jgi:hypothetical protein
MTTRWLIIAGFVLVAVAVAVVTWRLRALELKVAILQARADTPKPEPVKLSTAWGTVTQGAPADGYVAVRRLGRDTSETFVSGAYLNEGQYVVIGEDGVAYPTPYPGD